MKMNTKQRASMYLWLEDVGQYGGQDGERIDIRKNENGSVTVMQTGLANLRGIMHPSGVAEVEIDETGRVTSTTTGEEVVVR